jgi:hypothetical protein
VCLSSSRTISRVMLPQSLTAIGPAVAAFSFRCLPRRPQMNVRIFSLLFLMLAFGRAQAAELYVSAQGNDANPGTSAQPFRTITRAYNAAVAGTTIVVMPGVYTDYQSGWGLRLNRSGTASSPIVLRSQVKGAAIIDGQNGSDRNKAIYLDGNYNVIDGFEIRGGPTHGIFIYGSFNQILNNKIHGNGNVVGGQGVYSSQTTRDNRYEANYIHDNGLPGSNLDHGLYLCGDNELVINNVLVRNAAYGLHIAGYTTVSNMRVYNNVMAHNGKSGIILWMAVSGIDIKNNIIYRNGHYGIDSFEAHGGGVVVDRNLVFGNGLGDYEFTRGLSDYTYTFGSNLSTDPLFVNATATGLDAHLRAGSPAIDTGENLSSVFTTDKDGTLRPSSGAWDLGAYVAAWPNSGVPQIATQPADQTVGAGQSASFSVTASGATPLSYQWQKNGANISGATASSYTTPATLVFDNASTYRCVVTNSAGSQTSSSATLTVLTPSTKFTVGTQVTPTSTANVRATPAGTLLGTQPVGAVGTVTDGPVFAILNSQNVWWWNINFALGVSGWVGEDALERYSPPPPPLMPSLSFEAEAGQILFPFVVSGGAVSQSTNTMTPSLGGAARYRFNITQPADYIVRVAVNATNVNADSLFINIDADPTDPVMIWDIGVTTGIEERIVSWRGNGTFDTPQFSPKIFSLAAGEHTLTIRGREANAAIDRIKIEIPSPRPSPPQRLRVVSASSLP